MCGVIGIFNHPEAATLCYLGLYAQQHRGQESAGIVSAEDSNFHIHHGMGHVSDVFKEEHLKKLAGKNAIGHVRYSTHGASTIKNVQPFAVKYARGSVAVAHNGNIVNAKALRQAYEKDGAIFQSSMDTEVIIHQLAKSRKEEIVDRIKEALPKLTGSYSLVFLTKTRMIAARDPGGFRPLVIGKKGDAYVVASETCALDLIEAEYIREVEPGEIVVFDKDKIESIRFADATRKKNHCIFEYIYFARPDSYVFSRNVYEIRKGFGNVLAREAPVEADVIVPVPDSGVPAAIGFSQESGIPFEMGLVRNHYVGRTFIEPEQNIRSFGVRVKLNPARKLLEGKRVVLVDDSIVRGTTSKKIIKMVRDAGAKEVHMRISSPPTKWPCFYGIDTPSRNELVSARKSVEEIRQFIQADTLSYLSVEGLFWFDKHHKNEWFCDACFTGKYTEDRDEVARAIKEETGEMLVAL